MADLLPRTWRAAYITARRLAQIAAAHVMLRDIFRTAREATVALAGMF